MPSALADDEDCDDAYSARRNDPRDDECEERVKEEFDPESGLSVIKLESDVDWKVAKPKIPWSKILWN